MTSNKVREKAKRLRDSHGVSLAEYDRRRALAVVNGDHGQYTVRLYNEGDSHFKAFCTCPSSDLWCSHAIAAFELWRWQLRPWWVRVWWTVRIWIARTFLRKDIDL